MASAFSHLAIPLTLKVIQKSISARLLFLGVFLSIMPDFDVVAFLFGIPYESPYGHRGFTHSIVFAFLVAMLFLPMNKTYRISKLRLFLFLFISTLSHSLLDGFTNGGFGVALFWPFDNTRYFAPYRPVEVSPIGIKNFFTQRGLEVIWSEIKTIWIPCLVVVITCKLGQKYKNSKNVKM